MPVVEGWRSTSLFWIAPSWRRDRLPPAPPPVDVDGRLLGSLHRIEEAEVEAFVDSLPDLAESGRADRHDARRVLQSEDGKRLFISEQGQAYYFEPALVAAASRGTRHSSRWLWDELTRSVGLESN